MKPGARVLAVCGLLLPGLVLGGCSSEPNQQTPGGQDAGEQDSGATETEGSLTVYAAASLTESFTELGERFEEDTGYEVSFNFAGSANLAAQIQQGAPADVFASADERNMERVEQAGLVAVKPEIFAANTLVLVTPEGNPAAVSGLADLAREDLITVICAPAVPCGAASLELAQNAGVELNPDSEESAVTDVLGKVRSGEADAGLVYATDALTAGPEVETLDVEGSSEVLNRYPIAALENAPNPEAAAEFVDFVLSEEAQELLNDAGFVGLDEAGFDQAESAEARMRHTLENDVAAGGS